MWEIVCGGENRKNKQGLRAPIDDQNSHQSFIRTSESVNDKTYATRSFMTVYSGKYTVGNDSRFARKSPAHFEKYFYETAGKSCRFFVST